VVGLRVDTVRLPHGGASQREIVEHGASVVLVPIDPQGRVLMVRQYRKPIERSLLELPAGTRDHKGESPAATARRELEEERNRPWHPSCKMRGRCRPFSSERQGQRRSVFRPE